MVTDLHARDELAHRLHDPCRLVSQDFGQQSRVRSLDVVQVAVAQPDIDGSDADLERAGLVDPQRLEVEVTGLVQDGRADRRARLTHD